MQRDPAMEYLSRRTNALDRRAYLRPMRVGEMLDIATRAYQKLGKWILQYTATPMLLAYSVLVFFFVFLAPSFFATSNPNDVMTQLGEALSVAAVGLLVALPLFFIGLAYSQAFVTLIVSDFVVGNTPDPKAALEGARRSVWVMLAVSLRVFLSAFWALFAGGVLLAIGAIATDRTSANQDWAGLFSIFGTLFLVVSWVFPLISIARYSLAPVIVAVEGCSVKVAMSRARELVKSTYGHPSASDGLIGVILLCFFLFAVIFAATMAGFSMIGIDQHVKNWLGSGPIGEIVLGGIGMLPAYFALWVVSPVWCATCTLLYFDRRIRLEGYDIYILEQDVRRANSKSRFEF